LPARAIFVLYLSPTRYGDQSGDQNTRSRGSDFTLDNHSHPEDFEPTFRCRDWDYIKTFGLSLVAGRYPYSSNTLKEVVLNENSVKQLGFRSTEQIVGHLFRWGDLHSPGCVIVGVVHDFIDGSLKEKIGPLMLVTMANQYQLLAVKVDPLRSKDITWHWREFSGGYIRRIFIMPNGSTRGLRVPHSYAYRHLGHEPVAFIVFLSCADRLVDPAVCYSPFAGDRPGYHWVEGISCGAGQSGFQLAE
jgi:hypothetical protein